MNIAQTLISFRFDWIETIELAKKIAIEIEEDYEKEATMFIFKDESKLEFCDNDFYEIK
jgi:hypothetical protein